MASAKRNRTTARSTAKKATAMRKQGVKKKNDAVHRKDVKRAT